MTRFLRDHLERNFVSSMAGQYEERKNYISQNPNNIAVKADLLLLSAGNRHPKIAAKILGLKLPDELEYVGAGSAHTVVRVNDVVMKIHRASEFMSDAGRAQLAEQQTEQHSQLLRYIGNIALPQITEVNVHPLKANRNVVMSRQADMKFYELGIFSAYTPHLNVEALEVAKADYPGIEYPLLDLVWGARKLFDETGMLVDTTGQDNIVMAERELRCLDGLPIVNPSQGDVRRILGQLDSLAVLL